MGDAGGIKRRGLRVDLAKAQAWQRRSAERYAAKQRARRQAARITSPIAKPPRSRADWPTGVRKLAGVRSGGMCELCRVSPACHLHHRKLRRHGDHRIVNALHLCTVCHDRVHNFDGSHGRGFLVKKHIDPAIVPVQPFDRPAFYLTANGTYREAA